MAMAVWDGPGFQEGQTAPGTYLKNNLESTESYTLRAVRSIIFQVRRKKKKATNFQVFPLWFLMLLLLLFFEHS